MCWGELACRREVSVPEAGQRVTGGSASGEGRRLGRAPVCRSAVSASSQPGVGSLLGVNLISLILSAFALHCPNSQTAP